MGTRNLRGLAVALVLVSALLTPSLSRAGHGHSGHSGGHGAGGMNPWGRNPPGFFMVGGFGPIVGAGFFPFGYPPFFYNPAGYGPFGPPPALVRSPVVPVAPQAGAGPVGGAAGELKAREARPADPGRSGTLVTLGDRLFRANNTKKAEERYLQALRTDPHAAGPRVRLAQLALVRGQYAEAAHRLREAETVQPGWLDTAPDIQSIYGEPGDFGRQIARLESHLHAHPQDRDAWLVLGAQWYLSGRTGKAADIFQRLNDPSRRPDIALAAFLDATEPGGPNEPNTVRAAPQRAAANR